MVFHGRKGRPVKLTVKQLADLVQGTVQGDGDITIQAARPLNVAQPGDITFAIDNKHVALLHNCRASAAVVSPSVPPNGIPLIRVADPLHAFIIIVRHLRGDETLQAHGIDPRASVHPSAVVGPNPSIHAFASVGEGTVLGARCRIHPGASIGRNCKVGDDVVLYPNAVVYDEVQLGNRVTLHSNSVVGADGFGFRMIDGTFVKVPQLGHVEIGDDVEVGACSTIDRGTFEPTRIGTGTKIDNLVQVGHNCQIGEHNLFVSQVGIAGSCSTGNHVVIAGQVGIADHIHIGTGAVIGARAGVTKEVAPGQRMLGAPATPEREQKRILMTLEKLPEMRKDLRRILQHLGLPME